MHQEANWRNEARELLGPGKGYPEYNPEECPKCGGDRFYYNLDTHKGTCHKGSCGFSVRSFFSLVRALETLNRTRIPGLNWESEEKKQDTILHGEAVPVKDDEFCYNYCKHRGMTDEEMAKISVWAYPSKRTIVLPVDNIKHGGESPYVRYLDPKAKIRWRGVSGFERKEHCFGARYIPDDARVCVLVEGIFDIITPGLLGYGIATLGASISDDILNYLERRFETIWVWPDNDEAGENYFDQLLKEFGYRKLRCVNVADRLKAYTKKHKKSKDPGDFERMDWVSRRIRKIWKMKHERIDL